MLCGEGDLAPTSGFIIIHSLLISRDIKVGGGRSPPVGFQVAANYVAMVPSGQIFDRFFRLQEQISEDAFVEPTVGENKAINYTFATYNHDASYLPTDGNVEYVALIYKMDCVCTCCLARVNWL
ncbi:Peptidyl-prolyl cis-trans isomerase FKBP16-3, chloroplastic, partial [Sesamum angolense]